MVYKSEILTGVDANIARVQDRLNSELPWAANCDIFGRISINQKNNSDVFEWYNSNGEYKEIFINDQKSIIGFIVSDSRDILPNEFVVSVLFSVYIPLTYLDALNHDEHVIMDAQRVLRNCGLIKVTQINTNFEEIYKGLNINRIKNRNLYPFVNFMITGTMRYIDKCLNYTILRNLTYSNFSAVYAEDSDYNDIITCSLTVTNNTSVSQNATIYFRLGDYFVQMSQVIPQNSSSVFTYDFENVDIYVENIVTAHDSAMAQVGSVTLAATAMPVFEMFYTSGTLSFRVGRYVEGFTTYLALENGSTREVNINNYADNTYIAISQVYALATSKRIHILYPFSVDYLYIYNQANLSISYNEIEKLRNLTYLYINQAVNCTITANEISKLTNLTYLLLSLTNVTITVHEIEKLINLTQLYLYTVPNVTIAANEISKLINLVRLDLIVLFNVTIAAGEISKLTNLTQLQINAVPNVTIDAGEISKLTNLNKTIQLYIYYISSLSIASNEVFATHYLYLNNSNMTTQSVDNVFISCYNQLLGGFVPGTKNINTAGATNAKVTSASLTARNYLVAQGYTLTYNS